MHRATYATAVIVGLFACGCGDSSESTGGGGSSSMGGGSNGGGAEGPWQPPIGIPAPEFGVDEVAPAPPSSWDAQTEGFYYVDATAEGATDDGNPYGTPSMPRWSIPNELPAGSVVELHGTYDHGHESPNTLRVAGTAEKPVFIRGVDADHKPIIRTGWEVTGTYYILENLEFAPTDDVTTGFVVMREPTSHGALRDSDVHGNLNGGGTGVVVWTDAGVVDNVLIFRNSIHDNGDVNADFDQDVHGIAVGAGVSNLWVLDNELMRNSGDGIQINAGSQDAAETLHHVYVGRNAAHENKQTGFWTKQAIDVIFSQNLSYGHHASNSSLGQCMGYQYNPDYVWFLYNAAVDCQYGLAASSNDDDSIVTHTYFIGNLVANIHASAGYDESSAWSEGAAIMLAGGYERYVVNNTLLGVDMGISSPGVSGKLVMQNNLIAYVGTPGGHVFLDQTALASSSTIDHELYEGAVSIRWGDYTPLGMAAFQDASPGNGADCVNADPAFVDLENGDFHLTAGSPAVDAGVVSSVYAAFEERYGIDIAKDVEGNARPQGSAWDLGALELVP